MPVKAIVFDFNGTLSDDEPVLCELFIEMFTLQRVWTDLTDDELFWKPTEDSWTVGPAADCRTATPFVSGSLAAAG